jgi:hypothetical protein
VLAAALCGHERNEDPKKKYTFTKEWSVSLIGAIIFDTYPTHHVLLKVELLKKDQECFDT